MKITNLSSPQWKKQYGWEYANLSLDIWFWIETKTPIFSLIWSCEVSSQKTSLLEQLYCGILPCGLATNPIHLLPKVAPAQQGNWAEGEPCERSGWSPRLEYQRGSDVKNICIRRVSDTFSDGGAHMSASLSYVDSKLFDFQINGPIFFLI